MVDYPQQKSKYLIVLNKRSNDPFFFTYNVILNDFNKKYRNKLKFFYTPRK